MIQIWYEGNRFIVEKMSDKEKAKLKEEKPKLYEKYFPETAE